jgi:hypothetical protein
VAQVQICARGIDAQLDPQGPIGGGDQSLQVFAGVRRSGLVGEDFAGAPMEPGQVAHGLLRQKVSF